MGYSEGQLPYWTPKGEREHSMVVKVESGRIARKLVCQDLIPMTKARLPEFQSLVEANQLGGKNAIDNPSPLGRAERYYALRRIETEIRSQSNPSKREQLLREHVRETNGKSKGIDKRTMTYPRIA